MKIISIIGILSVIISFHAHPAKQYNIKEFGAKGNGKTINTDFINKAIDTCAENGGGTVIIPSGIFLTGTIVLKSNVTLHLQTGAILKGSENLSDYQTVLSYNKDKKYYTVNRANWNKALILGDRVNNVALTGHGMIDGGHVEDIKGEEGMRGPHILFLSRSSNITVSDVRFRQASNYAFMSYDIENVLFSRTVMEEGWDGIHIRGGKNIQIRNCNFFTGDDAIAGGEWENVVIDRCLLNSSCNGIRIIMPVRDMHVSDCRFEGPGKYPHRTSRQLNRRNMLTGLMVQPGGWFEAPGKTDDIKITSCHFHNLDNPFLFTLNTGNNAGKIVMRDITGTSLNEAAASFESWNGGYFSEVELSDIRLEYVGKDNPELLTIIPSKPRTDYRLLPCWGFFFKNIARLSLENIQLSYTDREIRPVFYLDNVSQIRMKKVTYPVTENIDPIMSIHSGKVIIEP